MIVEGQIAGGVAQGIGAVMLENLSYDESGQILTTSLMDYLILAHLTFRHLNSGILETYCPISVGGIKGMGEGGLSHRPWRSLTLSAIPWQVSDGSPDQAASFARNCARAARSRRKGRLVSGCARKGEFACESGFWYYHTYQDDCARHFGDEE